ncbi:hypothetical protein DFJ73DRAFT_831981 [Zopfochytrium polystomum]|nr:hypothetical protein DFJ73DRAFT_831981 [Zopfochytrium polystomum]
MQPPPPPPPQQVQQQQHQQQQLLLLPQLAGQSAPTAPVPSAAEVAVPAAPAASPSHSSRQQVQQHATKVPAVSLATSGTEHLLRRTASTESPSFWSSSASLSSSSSLPKFSASTVPEASLLDSSAVSSSSSSTSFTPSSQFSIALQPNTRSITPLLHHSANATPARPPFLHVPPSSLAFASPLLLDPDRVATISEPQRSASPANTSMHSAAALEKMGQDGPQSFDPSTTNNGPVTSGKSVSGNGNGHSGQADAETIEDDNARAARTEAVAKRRRWRVPLFVLILSYVAVSTVTVGVLGWQITMLAASSSIQDLASQIQARTSSQILSLISQNANVVTRVVSFQREMFRSNEWSLSEDRRNSTMSAMLSVLKRFQNWTSVVHANTYPEGALFGWSYAMVEGRWTLEKFEQFNHTLLTYTCDDDGNTIAIKDILTSQDETYDNPGTNGTLLYGGNSVFGYNMNFSDFDFHRMGGVYLYLGDVAKTAVAIAYNPTLGEETIVGSDWEMDTVRQQVLKQFAQQPDLAFVAAMEALTGRIVASSTGAEFSNKTRTSLSSSSNFTTPTFDSLDEPFFEDLTNKLLSLFPEAKGSTYLADTLFDKLMSTYGTNGTLSYSTNVGGRSYLARVDLTEVLWDEPWVVVQYLDVDRVLATVNRASTTAEILILSVVAVAVLLGTVFAVLVARQIQMVAKSISKLRDVGFTEALVKEVDDLLREETTKSSKPTVRGSSLDGIWRRQKPTTVERSSARENVMAPIRNTVVLELGELQGEFYAMTRRFVDHARTSRYLMRSPAP